MQLTASQSSPTQDLKILVMQVAEKRRSGPQAFEGLYSPDLQRACRHGAGTRSITSSFNEVMEVAQAALATREPEKAIADRLRVMQTLQQARLNNLPEPLKHNHWVLLRHGQALQRNQAIHDAAIEILHVVKSWSQAA